jgi:hypothetical protein
MRVTTTTGAARAAWPRAGFCRHGAARGGGDDRQLADEFRAAAPRAAWFFAAANQNFRLNSTILTGVIEKGHQKFSTTTSAHSAGAGFR